VFPLAGTFIVSQHALQDASLDRKARRLERHDRRRQVAGRVELLLQQRAESECNARVVPALTGAIDGRLDGTEAKVRPGRPLGCLLDERVVQGTERGTQARLHTWIGDRHGAYGTARRYPERVTSAARFNLFETFRIEEGHVVRGALHLARFERSARALGMPYDGREVERKLNGLPPGTLRGRLELTPEGTLELHVTPFTPDPPGVMVRVAWAAERIDATQPARRHKTRDRAPYDRATRAAQAAGFADLLFLNELGEVAEGAISTVAVERDGERITPPTEAGALPGILRQTWLETGWAREGRITPGDVREATRLWIGSSLRGARQAELVDESVTQPV